MKLCVFGIFCLVFALAVSEAGAQAISVSPANPVIATGEIQQFTATGNVTPSLVSASGSHTCALLPDGTVRCWGYNEFGQLGDGTTMNSSIPVAVAGITNAITVAAGHHHTCALLADGTVRCWGSNQYGQLGDGTNDDAHIPVAVSGIFNVTAVTPGAYHTCALLADGTVRCWGDNDFGELGDGTNTSASTPVAVTGLAAAPTAVAAGAFHTCAVLPDGAVQCWGRNDFGQLGDGDTPNSSTPVTVSGLASVAALSAGGYHNCALLPDGTLRCWGRNNFGQLGDGSSLTYLISSNNQGFIGIYNSTLLPGSISRTPVEVAGISTATAVIAGGFHTCAPLSDGSVKCWGENDDGQLGNGTSTSSSTPVSVIGLPPVAAVSAGAWHTCALLPDGTVQCWGMNLYGQLGNGTTTDSETAVAVTGSGPVTWTSSDTAVATIDAASGLATALNLGSTTITATANGVSGSTVLAVVNRVTLSVVREGTGSGTVSSGSAGISCGTDCSETYPSGAVVTLTATPDSGSTFEGWTGGGCTGTGTCAVTVTADTTVFARFDAATVPSP